MISSWLISKLPLDDEGDDELLLLDDNGDTLLACFGASTPRDIVPAAITALWTPMDGIFETCLFERHALRTSS